MLRSYIKTIITLGIVLICVGGIFTLQKPALQQTEKNLSKEEYSRISEQKNIQLNLTKKLPSLGFDNLIADAVYLDFIQYYGDYQARLMTNYDLLPSYFEIVVNRDPRFVTAYFLLEPATTLFASRPDISNALLSKGLQYLKPEQDFAYQIWSYKGVIQILYLNDLEGAIKSYRKAAEWGKIKNTESSLFGAKLAEETANFLATKPDTKVVVANSWLSIYLYTRDEQARQIALHKIEDLGGKIEIKGNRASVLFPESN